ncbi:Phosphatidylglycerophosphatase A [hydrothermal vent metagenome]|uniref:Phosphatidylglycerophosphatase A n=1 Tax=hydrothermal vent metagenome TaxID=652676 RepID=A0A3B0ZZ72_9ZZZZ
MIKYFRAAVPFKLLLNPIHLLSFGFGSGLSPFASGTFGTLAAIPFYYYMQSLPITYYLLMVALTFALGVYICDVTSKALGVHDHGAIVWDEFVGYFITMIALPSGWTYIIVGFFMFRVFDVFKPWPINILDEKVSGGFGIMIDDVLAGVYALVCMQILVYFGFFEKINSIGLF